MVEALRPLEVIEEAETGNRFVAYVTRDGIELQCMFDGEQPWFTQKDLAGIFGVGVPAINEHIKRFLADEELDNSVIRDFRITAGDGKSYTVKHYGLDVAFYVGYRVNSKEGKLFRRWATAMLVQLATKGFVVQTRRLKGGENSDRIRELREVIRDIRSEEANLYAEIRNICAMCKDYDAHSQGAVKFFQLMQAKLFFAVVSQTPAQVIVARADAAHESMGLRSWKGERVLQSDALIGKNYLAEGEVKELNRLVSILLDVFEDQLDIGKLTSMSECSDLLDRQLRQLSRPLLASPGPPSATEAEKVAKDRYKIFGERRRSIEKVRADRELAELRTAARALPSGKPSKKKKKT